MYSKIMVPVDLAHINALQRGLKVAADLARHYEAEVCYVSVAAPTPGPVAHNPEEHEEKLAAFAQQQSEAHGRPASSKLFLSHDPAVDMDDVLVKAIDEVGADLVIMATHLPRALDAILPAHGGKVASHTDASIFLVRPGN